MDPQLRRTYTLPRWETNSGNSRFTLGPARYYATSRAGANRHRMV
jgi:hypothetical protein